MAARQRRGNREQLFDPTVPGSTATGATGRSRVSEPATRDTAGMSSFIRSQPVWIVLAVASGACAAINGVFAKLTTTSLTSTLATRLATALGLEPDNNTINMGLRGGFFGLNLLFNGIMWTLFTMALTKGSSTTRVSIINVSANFFVTAMLGWAIFDEKLPLGWWMGAGLLAAGNVVIGRREEGEKKVADGAEVGLMGERDDLIELDGEIGDGERRDGDEDSRVKRGESIDDPI